MKVQMIQNAFNPVRKISKSRINITNKFSKSKLPVVETPILLYLLRNEKDEKSSLIKETLENKYVLPQRSDNLNFVSQLERDNIISPQKPWESPAFNNGVATDSYYNSRVNEIKNSTLLSPSEKDAKLREFANLNNRTYTPSFGNNETDIHNTPYTGEDNIQNEPTGFWDSIKSKYQDVQNKFKKILGINNEPVAETTSISEVNADIQLQQDLDWVNSINEKMCPECEEIYNAIPTEIPEGLMSNIMGDIPEGFMGDKDLLKMLKDMTKDFLGEQ